MKYGTIDIDEQEWDDKNILVNIILLMLIYTITLAFYSYDNGFHYILCIPYMFCLVGYYIISEINDEIKQRNDLRFKMLNDADTKYHNALKEALDRF